MATKFCTKMKWKKTEKKGHKNIFKWSNKKEVKETMTSGKWYIKVKTIKSRKP